MKQDEVRQLLIDGTIHVIANYGLDGATTKQIGKETGVNEAYIYRQFNDKEDMFVQTFSKLDDELIEKILEHLPIMDKVEIDIVARCKMFFYPVWKFLLGNEEKCTCYIRYYCSPYFKKHSFKKHQESFTPVIEKFKPAFKPGANTWMLMNHILDIMLSSAVKVFNGELEDNDETAKYIFDLIYFSVERQFSWSEQVS